MPTFYFSGLSDPTMPALLHQAGVHHVLGDPTDFPRLMSFPSRTLDNGAYRAFKNGRPLDIPAFLSLVEQHHHTIDFAIAPDVVGDPTATHPSGPALAPTA